MEFAATARRIAEGLMTPTSSRESFAMQRRHNDVEPTAYCRQQASACAAAALTAAIAEIKQAYLDLEQGWLSLAPKPETNSAPSGSATTTREVDSKPNRARSRKGAHNATR